MKYVVDESNNQVNENEQLDLDNKNKTKIKKDKKERKKHNFSWLKPVRTAVVAFLIFTGILGLGYTVSVTVLAQTLFPFEANGSLITVTLNDGSKKVYGSELIGQSYLKMDNNGNYVLKDNNDKYYVSNKENEYYLDENANFMLDKNETTKLGENVATNVVFQAKYLIGRFNQGGPSNSAVTTKIYKETIESRKAAINDIGYNDSYNEAHSFKGIPSELLTESGSGCDPEISYDTALYQIPMIAKERDMEYDEVKKIIDNNTKGKFLGIFGTTRVNVLLVNLELDGLIN